MEKKRIAKDLIYCIVAVGMMNAVLQLIVYPIINNRVGETGFGQMLFMLGILNILAPSFGQGVGNARLVLPRREKLRNRDYNIVIAALSLVSAVIAIVFAIERKESLIGILLFAYVIVISIYRMYGNTEYRFTLDFKKQFVFYLVLSIGYVVGLLLFWMTKQWYWVFIIGETMAVLYVVFTGNIFGKQKGQELENRFQQILKSSVLLSVSYLVTNLLLNLDRFILLYMIDSNAVSQYYVLSLLGKTAAIVSGPVNSVIIGYITKDDTKIRFKSYLKGVALLLGVGALFVVACSIVTPIYIKLLYPNLYGAVEQLNVIVNAAQIIYFVTNVLLIIILTMCDIKWQFIIQVIYAIVFICSAIMLTKSGGLAGFAISAFWSSIFFFVLTALVGLHFARKNK